jgi:uncharacterized cofD-like protein
LAIRGRIYPSTNANVGIQAELEDGSIVCGETRISRSRKGIRRIRLSGGRCKPLPETLDAIAQADLITLGPGSLFTSVIPNLLVSGVSRAIRTSPALKAYFVNLMWQPGETIDFRASDHIRAIRSHAGGKLLDYAVINTSTISAPMRKRYALEKVSPVENDIETILGLGIEVVSAKLLRKGAKVRHDPSAAAAVAMDLAHKGRLRKHL